MGKVTHTTHRIRTQCYQSPAPAFDEKALNQPVVNRHRHSQRIPPGRFYIKAKSEQSNKVKHQKEQNERVRSANCRAHPKSGYAYVRSFSTPPPAALGGNTYPRRKLIFNLAFLGLCFLFIQLTVLLCTWTAALILPGSLFLELVNPSNSHGQQARNASSRLSDWTPFLTYSDVFRKTEFSFF